MNKAKSKFYLNKDRLIIDASTDWVFHYFDLATERGTLDAMLRRLWERYSEGSPSTKEDFLRIGKALALTDGYFEPDSFIRSELRLMGLSVYYEPFLPSSIRRHLKVWGVSPMPPPV